MYTVRSQAILVLEETMEPTQQSLDMVPTDLELVTIC